MYKDISLFSVDLVNVIDDNSVLLMLPHTDYVVEYDDITLMQ